MKDTSIYVHKLTGVVKSAKELRAMWNRKIDRNRTRADITNFIAPDLDEIHKLPRRARRGLERRMFKAKYGRVKL